MEQGTAIVKQEPFSIETLISRGIDKGITVETMERLLAMRTQLKQENAREQYYAALAKFQKECPIIKKTKTVTNGDGSKRYSYAPLESIIEQVKNVLDANGFSYSFKTEQTEKGVSEQCYAHHIAGHSDVSTVTVEIDAKAFMSGPQKVGAAMTYAKRYAFCGVFGIMTMDEDTDAQEEEVPQTKEQEKQNAKDDLKDLQLRINGILKEKFSASDIAEADKVAVFQSMFERIRGSKMSDYEKKSIKSALDITNPVLLAGMLAAVQEYKL